MSVATSPPPGSGEVSPPGSGEPRRPYDACPLCGAPLQANQEWCLRCGAAARTRLAATPAWRAPIVALAVVVALAVGVLAVALVKLADDPPPVVSTTTVTTQAAASAPATRPSAGAAGTDASAAAGAAGGVGAKRAAGAAGAGKTGSQGAAGAAATGGATTSAAATTAKPKAAAGTLPGGLKLKGDSRLRQEIEKELSKAGLSKK